MSRRPPPKAGFQFLSPEDRKKIAAAGGRIAHARGRAHRWTVAEARAAGKKGGRTRGEQLRKKKVKVEEPGENAV